MRRREMVDELFALHSLLQRTLSVERRIAELAAAIDSSDLSKPPKRRTRKRRRRRRTRRTRARRCRWLARQLDWAGDDFKCYFYIQFDSWYAPRRQFTECLNFLAHFLRECRPRTLRSMLGVFALPEESMDSSGRLLENVAYLALPARQWLPAHTSVYGALC